MFGKPFILERYLADMLVGHTSLSITSFGLQALGEILATRPRAAACWMGAEEGRRYSTPDIMVGG